MRVANLVELGLLSALLGCSGQQTTIGSSVGEKKPVEEAAPEAFAFGGGGGATAPSANAGGSSSAKPALPPAAEEPDAVLPPDPAVVKALVDKTGEAAADNPLHLRLEISPGAAGELWLVGVVNRGTELAKLRFDLRRLTLTLTPPEPSTKPRAWKPKPKPIVCKLPEGFAGLSDASEPQLLAPGEGLVQTFDPRLYCISASGDSLLATGQHITAKLGFAPKPPRVVWKHGARTEQPVLQA
ncbi:MAG TPA: hypothetical protein VEQ59_20920, partial [Polyangiaceae bacterium]|nr:hypothetical protein [Polyangiaceae bacterium]